MSQAETGTPAARRRKIFLLADALGLTRDERIELAEVILRRDLVSWKQLDDAQVDRMLDVLEGAAMVIELQRQRR
ncbi:hypothetical protein [Gemmatimonas sp.]|uniref:hypothetical protein n=1 Tax=Gemmatimonas sp. TaxID=1962908 RepID=UPI003564D7DC